MSEPFVPPGYVRIARYDGDCSRQRFASGELVAAGWNPRTGELIEIHKDHWQADWSQTMIDTGLFDQKLQDGFGGTRVERLPVLVRIDDGHERSAPNPTYVSPFLQMMIDATNRFSIAAGKNPPKKAELEEYFKRQKLPDGTPISSSQAKAMATFIRPPEAMKGGQKKMG
jgi:hypothetical protein